MPADVDYKSWVNGRKVSRRKRIDGQRENDCWFVPALNFD